MDIESEDESLGESLGSDTKDSSNSTTEVQSNDEMDEVEEEDEELQEDDDDEESTQEDESDHLDEEGELGQGEDDERFFPNSAGGADERKEGMTLPTESDLEESGNNRWRLCN